MVSVCPITSHAELRGKSLIASRFICGDLIVKTGRSALYHGWDALQDKPVVLKRPLATLTAEQVEQWQREGDILRQNSSARLLKGEGYRFDGDRHWLIMAPAKGRLLLDLMQSGQAFLWSENIRRAFTCSLIKALVQLHDRGLCHGDIKPDNIFVDPVTAKVQLIDFSACEPVDRPVSKRSYSPDWHHPTLDSGCGRQVDSYGAALLVWCLWTGSHPFEKRSVISFFNSPSYWPVQTGWKNWLDGHWLRRALKQPEQITLGELNRRFGCYE
ncbi:hypothetical protein EOPP23_06660 [Endozoicomonas sp. OPT23]|uniref:protein kinase domain-containing protein n=1 Tax=Endozoicomonas sp. OPT23 TaxID=2072845 RepID=UPI00129B4EA7|nr:protein kinase [Endozoicomonas sp. OPT23]MRI32668.1 hypothetical protein [Endozoicomonas sp. OPT23]